ncbi:MAG: ABC transporter ATP-binding protein [Actinobacteria bacterium]|nr:MAG: ABC transporter ATP-binding protein [Actinomycetota bacterium]
MSDSVQATAPAVRGENLSVVYRKRTVLDVPSIELPAGRTYALLGASGAGKSTLLRVLGLLERPRTGAVYFDGAIAESRNLAVRRQVAAVFQKPYLLRGTVGDNVRYGLKLRRHASREADQAVSDALERVGLAGWEKRSALTLSGGEAQRVALARALVLRPRFLLLDEPLSYLDPLLKRQLTIEFAEILSGAHVTALYVTHDQDEAAVVADIIGVMREGRIVAEGDPHSVLTLSTDPWVSAFMGAERPLDGVVLSTSDGTMRIACGEIELFATGTFSPGSPVIVGVRPEDVILLEADASLTGSSARNQLRGRVTEVTPLGTAVRIGVDSGGVQLASLVSRASAESMRLAPGVGVTLLFKATAVQVRLAQLS